MSVIKICLPLLMDTKKVKLTLINVPLGRSLDGMY